MVDKFITAKLYGFQWNIKTEQNKTILIESIYGRNLEVNLQSSISESKLTIKIRLAMLKLISTQNESCDFKFILPDGTLYGDEFSIIGRNTTKARISFSHPIKPTDQIIERLVCRISVRTSAHSSLKSLAQEFKKANDAELVGEDDVSDQTISLCQVCQDLQTLLLSKSLSDVKIVTRDGEELEAHKNILAARSPVFQEMFVLNKEENNDMIYLNDVEFDVISEVLKFIYTGVFENEVLHNSAAEILFVAQKYELDSRLREKCEEIVVRKLSADDFVKIFITADICDNENLKTKVIDFFIANKLKLSLTERADFKELKKTHPHLLEEIISKI